ncbi:high-affinity choline transporter 1-like [Clytia hemisphaerica]|uniref:Uncharacterized protein n=1 Tax=Clytia hemisphaerica TaxID=252671 RepID=A0A7M5WTS6_9CNID
MASINWWGLAGIILFYVVILVIGLLAARYRNKRKQAAGSEGRGEEEVMLAGRSIGLFVGGFTMTATWVGGGYINGTSEAVNQQGLLWAQSPWGYALSLIIGGVMFAKIMRKRGYITLLDPFQERYGKRVGGIMYFPAFIGELLWSGATLKSLGATISVVMDLPMSISVIISAFIALVYTFFGGLWSVAFTDVAQLICMFIGMWLTIPFAMSNDAVHSISLNSTSWTGSWDTETFSTGKWIDFALLLIFGGIPWQVYFQRVLSSKSHHRAQLLSYFAAFGCMLMAVPSVLIGAIGHSTNWTMTDYGPLPEDDKDAMRDYYSMTMPLVLQYLTPLPVSFVGLGAVSAAVMSSVDSSVLSASSMFAHNIYRTIFRQTASEKEMVWVIRISIWVVGAIATTIALTVNTIYGLSYLCSDLIYVILFPQLICVLYFRYSNAYGAVISFFVGLILRILGGEPMIGLPAAIEYPGFDGTQNFPFRTFSMLVTIFILWSTSIGFHLLFEKGVLRPEHDVFDSFNGREIHPFSFSDMMVIGGVKVDEGLVDGATEIDGQNSSCEEKEEKNEKWLNGANGKHEEVELLNKNNNNGQSSAPVIL